MSEQAPPYIERRTQAMSKTACLNKLSLAQKFAMNSLGNFGYELAFVRNQEGYSCAVLTCDSGVVVIRENGDIDTTPDIILR